MCEVVLFWLPFARDVWVEQVPVHHNTCGGFDLVLVGAGSGSVRTLTRTCSPWWSPCLRVSHYTLWPYCLITMVFGHAGEAQRRGAGTFAFRELVWSTMKLVATRGSLQPSNTLAQLSAFVQVRTWGLATGSGCARGLHVLGNSRARCCG